MHPTRLVLTAFLLAGLAACRAPRPRPSPTAGPVAGTVASKPSPTQPTATPEAPTATATPAPPSATPTATPTPWVGELPAGTVALYAAGPVVGLPQLYALAADGSSTDLGRTVTLSSVASPAGHWVVRLDRARRAHSVVIANLQTGTTYTIPFGFDGAGTDGIVGQWAFDREESRLVFLEVAPISASHYGWAYTVVSLRDGSSRRYEMSGEKAGIGPGYPLGWSADGELLVDTFRPYSEGAYAGVAALRLPDDGGPLPADTRARPLLATGAYHWTPQLSPDGTRLLYLARDPAYTPAGYRPEAYDMAVNQLWSLDLASGQPTLLLAATDGSALGGACAWRPDGQEVLFAQGSYDGDTIVPLTLRVRGPSGAVSDVGTLPRGHLTDLRWCRPGLALATIYHTANVQEVYLVELAGGRTTRVSGEAFASVLACLP